MRLFTIFLLMTLLLLTSMGAAYGFGEAQPQLEADFNTYNRVILALVQAHDAGRLSNADWQEASDLAEEFCWDFDQACNSWDPTEILIVDVDAANFLRFAQKHHAMNGAAAAVNMLLLD
jgi:hypothetical protein